MAGKHHPSQMQPPNVNGRRHFSACFSSSSEAPALIQLLSGSCVSLRSSHPLGEAVAALCVLLLPPPRLPRGGGFPLPTRRVCQHIHPGER